MRHQCTYNEASEYNEIGIVLWMTLSGIYIIQKYDSKADTRSHKTADVLKTKMKIKSVSWYSQGKTVPKTIGGIAN